MKPNLHLFHSRRRVFILLGALVAGVLFFGVSVRITEKRENHAVAVGLPTLRPLILALEAYRQGAPVVVLPSERNHLVISGPERAEALTADHWLFVRQSITWANANSTLADNIITALKNGGLLANTGTITNTNVPIDGVSYKLKLETGGCAVACTASSTAYTGTKTFTNRFKLWRASDNKEALELLFDNVDAASIGANGVLMIYNLGVLGPKNSNNEALIVESYLSGTSPSRKQTYSWGQPFWIAPDPQATTASDAGRVVLEEMTFGLMGGGTVSGLGARIAVRTVSQTTWCGTGPHYFILAYMQKTDRNFETTAEEGLALNALPSGVTASTICSADVVKFGIFNGGGFVQDNLASAAVPTGYPDPSNVYGVQAEFDKIGTAGAGVGGYDDLQQTTIDALAPAFQSANDPP